MPVINIELPNTGTFNFSNSSTEYDLQARHDIVRISQNRFLAYIQQYDKNLGLTCLIEFDDLVNSDNYTVIEYKIVNISHFNGVRLYKIAENRVLGIFDTHIKIFDVVNDEVIITKEQSSVLTRGVGDIDSHYTTNWQFLHYDRFYAISIKENELLLIEKETSSITNPDYRFKKIIYDPVGNTLTLSTLKNLSSDSTISPITGEFELMNALIKPIPGTTDYLLSVSLTTWNDSTSYRYGYTNYASPYNHRGIDNYSKYDLDFCLKYVARIDQDGNVVTTYNLPGVVANGSNSLAGNNYHRAYAAIPLRDNLIVYLASAIHQGHMHSIPYTLYNGILKEGFSFRALENYTSYSSNYGRTNSTYRNYYPIYTIIPDFEPLDDNTFLVNYITSNTTTYGASGGYYLPYINGDNNQRSEFVIMQLKSDLVLEEGTVRNIGDPVKHKPTRKNILDKLAEKVYIAYRPITIVNNLVNFNIDRIDLR